MTTSFLAYEQKHAALGEVIAGADEAGRGPLAGPVVAAAVIMPPDDIIEGVCDSKKLSPQKREALYQAIVKKAIAWSVGVVDVAVIEKVNILNASRLAFQKAVAGLKIMPQKLYVDYITGLTLPMPYEAIIKGDATVYSIAAASIVAKVTRDKMMEEYEARYPQYSFAKHKGYGTKEHFAQIRSCGPCAIHRLSFLKKV